MEMNWEVFEHGPVQNLSRVIHVTINVRGNIFLNRRAHEALGRPTDVMLMYDRRRSFIGIGAARPGQAGAFRLRHKDPHTSCGRVLYASNFCRKYAIGPEETLRFMTAEVNKSGILVLDLNEVRSVKKIRSKYEANGAAERS